VASFDLKSYARRGARVRLRELAEEAKQLLNVFPDLSASFDADELPVNFILRAGARKQKNATGVRRRRRRMSAAQRKAVGERMRKYWAERRKAQAKMK
jgi:hypothetical protein